MKKRIISMMLAIAMLISLMPAITMTASAATKLSYAPYANVEYSYSTGVAVGTIRYICQLTSQAYFYADYWPSGPIGTNYTGPGNECGTSSISMALSYIGVNQTPKSLLNATEGKTALMWTTYGSAKCSSLGTSAASISAAMDNYINGNGKYSPLVIQMTPYPSSGNQHFVILAGKVSENEYFVVDPARPNGWTMTVSGSSASLSWTSGSYPITSVHQWYNPNASCDTTPPVISNVQIIDKDETGYTISCTVTDDIGVNRVQFPTWTENNGQDDLFADWTNNPAASGTQNGNVYTYRVKIADHNNETLNYITDIYAYDNYGNVAVSRDPVLQFVHIDVTATFNANGGSCSTSTKTVSPGSAIGTLPTPIRDGYEFAGWYPDLYAGSTPITSSTTVSSNVIYYAHWTSERNQDYHIVFNPNGGELPDVYKMMDVDGHNTGRGGAMLTVYDCDGMTYKHNGIGFVVAVNSNGRVVDKRIYGNSSDITVPNGGFLLSAQSQSPACKILEALPDVVYVAYDESSGRVYLYDSENAYISYHKYMSPYDSYEKLPVPTREGYVFDGWFPEMGNEIEWDTSYQPGEVRASWVPSESARPSVTLTNQDTGHLYERYDNIMSWEDAKEFCESRGGYLATITSAEEQELIMDGLMSDPYRSQYFIGASDAAKEGTWTWVTGENFAYSNWNQKVPEPSGGTTENYALIFATNELRNYTPGDWLDIANLDVNGIHSTCNTGFVCEYDSYCDHNYDEEVVEGNCQTPGYTTYTCTECGDTYTIYDGETSEWSTTKPTGVDEELIETKTQYRYADKETITSYEANLSGWTKTGSSWQQSGSGSVTYVKSWPSGFVTSHSLYSAYNKSPKSATETATDKTVINSDKVTGYLYFHWCRGDYQNGPDNRKSKATKQEDCDTFCAFYSTTSPSSLTAAGDGDGSYKYSNGSCCKDSYWYFYTPVYTQSYTTYRNLFAYERWKAWSDWSDSIYTASDTRKVETRTMYRTITSELGEHSWDEGFVTTEPTCTNEGEKIYTCEVCGDTKTEILPAVDHSYSEGYCTECGGIDPGYNFIPVVIAAENISAYPGDIVTVPVTITDNPGFAGFTLVIDYDNTAMELTNIAKGALLKTSDSGAFTKNVSGATINWTDYQNIIGDGTLLELTFAIHDEAAVGSYDICLSLKDGDSSNFVDEDIHVLHTVFESGTVTVEEENSVIASGYSGDLTWELTGDGVLTFNGSGAMKNYEYKSEMPWYSYLSQITTVILNEGVTSIGSYAFYGMPELQRIVIPESVTSIGDYAFKNSTALDGVTLPSGLTKLGESAFYGCASLSAIEIPDKLYTVQPYTFKNCTALADVTFHEGNLMKLSDGAFYGTALTEVVFPACLDIIDVYCFKNCMKLAQITLREGDLTQIREAVFYGTAISTIDIPKGVTKIGPYAFKNCVNLEAVSLPDTLTSVGEASFYANTALKAISLPNAVTDIGNYAFRKCAALETVEFSDSLVTIGESSFYGCESIMILSIPEKVTAIKGYAFKGCTGLQMVTLPESLVTLGESAFHTCSSLTEIVIPSGVDTVGAYCFSGSTGIDYIYFLGEAPTIGSGAFNKLTAIAYYPGDNAAWTSAVKQNYGGSITWKAN